MAGLVRRREDPRLTRGEGRYTDDVRIAGCLHAVFVRSPYAHARITSIDPAGGMVFTASDLQFASETARPRLCVGEVKFVGDAVAVAVGETREAAADAAASVLIDYEPLPVVVDSLSAHDDVAMDFDIEDDAVLEGADVIAHGRFVNQRLAAVPLEGNCVVAEPHTDGTLTVWVSTQVPFEVRASVAESLGLDEAQVRVITGDVGGGFGAKLMAYPEPSIVAAIAVKLGRPVGWTEYRSENMVAMTHGRGHVQDVEIGATRDGKLVGLKASVIADSGAYAGLAPPQIVLTTMLAPSVYELPHLDYRAKAVFTNTTVMSSYRGAGRPEAIALIERAMDMLAAELGIDPAELRRRNLLHVDFPYTSITGLTYDSGDYERALDAALEAADYASLRAEQRARRERGDRLQLGIGVSVYVEMTAVLRTEEHAGVRVESDGTFVVAAGTMSTGQGHETAYSQLAALALGVAPERIRVVQGDTAMVASGYGSSGSRSLQIGGSAVRKACIELVEKARAEAARRLEASPDDVEQRDGGFGVRGVPSAALAWSEVAPLAAAADFEQSDQTFPFGCHVAVVEVDVETGEAKLIDHFAVDDCGTVLNHMLVDGQVHGGVAQGVAQALYEEFVYDGDGNPLTASLIDYAIPTIGEIPAITTVHMETPSPLNPLGAKGIGESGTIGSTPAVQNAVIDAVSHLGVRHIDMPLHPMRVWEAIRKAQP